MMGYESPYVPGYDCHGLPIETIVEKKLAEKGKNKADIPVASFRRICREHASTAMNGQTRDFQRLGIFGEWETPYLTMSPEYESATARLFGTFLERGYVYKGLAPSIGASTTRPRWPRPRSNTRSTLHLPFT